MSEQPLSRVTLFVAVGLTAVLVLGVIILSQVLGGDESEEAASTTLPPRPTGPIALVGVDAPDASNPACASLVDALPAELPSKDATLKRQPLAEPAPPAAAAWAGDRGEPVVLRCGLAKPDELRPTAVLKKVSEVNWLPIEGAGAWTWYTVDRPVYIAVTIPEDTGTGVVQELSETIAKAVPATDPEAK
ncbi:DUF3515 domain-containing protein [Actinophytocola sp.]|uniref:DUF3515 domain-containing protein n=1 Tax=Actinophytocola sp. TaxID=1872138 RepID=UPI002ED3700E